MPKAKAKRGKGSAFVRTQPLDTPAAEVIKAAAARGIKVTRQTVHSARHVMRKANGAHPTKGKRSKAPKTNQPAHAANTPAQIKELRVLMVRVGLNTSRSMLDELQDALGM